MAVPHMVQKMTVTLTSESGWGEPTGSSTCAREPLRAEPHVRQMGSANRLDLTCRESPVGMIFGGALIARLLWR
jgi:hypothetical protein